MPGSEARPFVPEALEVVAQGDAERRGALPDLERAERVDVQVGHGVLDRAHDGDVVVAVERRVDPALEADLGRASVPRLGGPADDLLVRHEVGLAAEVRRQLSLREGAEAAAEVADVRVLDVPGDDVGDLVAVHLPSEPVGLREHALALGAAGPEEPRDLVLGRVRRSQPEGAGRG